jgi:hypothetical protein
MEAWRQWLLGGKKSFSQKKNTDFNLTPTGLLMEGVKAQKSRRAMSSDGKTEVVPFPKSPALGLHLQRNELRSRSGRVTALTLAEG